MHLASSINRSWSGVYEVCLTFIFYSSYRPVHECLSRIENSNEKKKKIEENLKSESRNSKKQKTEEKSEDRYSPHLVKVFY